MITRRGILRTLGLAAGAVLLPRCRAAEARPAPPAAREIKANCWAWTTLPGTGLEVYVTTVGKAPTIPVRWTADGTVTAAVGPTLTLRVTPAGDQLVTSGAGYSLTVRKVHQ